MFNYLKLDPEKVEFIPVAAVEDLPTGKRMYVEIDGQQIVVFNLAGGLFAIADVCSHDDGPVGDGDLEGEEVICPRHGARFDLRTGKALALPAVVDIPAYPVRVREGQIEVGLPL
jgi:3-phenylpropionate/trans-cinnamate dioxygenase ferredoxin component